MLSIVRGAINKIDDNAKILESNSPIQSSILSHNKLCVESRLVILAFIQPQAIPISVALFIIKIVVIMQLRYCILGGSISWPGRHLFIPFLTGRMVWQRLVLLESQNSKYVNGIIDTIEIFFMKKLDLFCRVSKLCAEADGQLSETKIIRVIWIYWKAFLWFILNKIMCLLNIDICYL